ncbi:aspartyl-tRNA synthetase 2, mitochondrial [Dissophora ornata]|nr:aspartyl-tRNA synthetase 2, mitochondrial [Dissophora ornata]
MHSVRARCAANALRRLVPQLGRTLGSSRPLVLVESRRLCRHSSTGTNGTHSTRVAGVNGESFADLQAELLDGVTFGILTLHLFEIPGDYPSRTHKCGDLSKANVGEQVVLTGWAQNIRKFSDELMFLPLRDHSGTIQLVLKGSDKNKENARQSLQELTAESVICVEGRVVAREEGTTNPKMATGDVEVDLISVRLLNKTHKNLPFSPSSKSLYKQLLMASGIDRYFQIAKCFRDEDLRADRQPEFTQIDLEVSFGSAKDIQTLVEGLVRSVWEKIKGVELFEGKPFPRMNYQLAMSQIQKVTDMAEDHIMEAIVLKSSMKLPGSDLKKLAQQDDRVLPVVKISDKNVDSWVNRLPFTDQTKRAVDVAAVNKTLRLQVGDIVILNTRPAFLSGGQTLLGKVRLELGNILQSKGLLHIPASQYNFLWVEGFPLFSPAETTSTANVDSRQLAATHHPFTAPVAEDLHLLANSPEKVRGQHYDLVLNGVEIGGGSIRIHSPKLQTFVFEQILQMSPLESGRFSHLVDALSFGCPPHGGLALGFDRLMAILCETSSIRDVIAFPKSASGRDLVVGSPSELTEQQLREYKIRVTE